MFNKLIKYKFRFFILSCCLLVITKLGDLKEAYTLIKDVEPAGPQEYVIKAVVNAALGQAEGSVSL